jgi:Kef-type K+ transport system membrane component KefB
MQPLFEHSYSILKNLLFYVAMLLVFGGGILFALGSGSRLDRTKPVTEIAATSVSVKPSLPGAGRLESSLISARGVLHENLRNPLSILLLQIIVILIAARLCGRLFLKIGQPAVVGEMIAGIILGPSVLGMLSPEALTFLFPASSLDSLKLLSQIGVMLFMFVVGMELNAQHLKERAQAALLVSHASILVPFFLGVVLSLVIYGPLGSSKTPFTAFALFMGIAMSLTAFPVLARIIEERGMSKTYLGSTAIACAAVADITAWCILPVVIAIVKANGLEASIVTIILALLFVGIMIFLLRPQIGRIITRNFENETRRKGLITGTVAFMFACAWFTELIGIHALFGAFLAGAVMPTANGYRSLLREKLETFSSAALLPLFFAFTGLRTQINLLSDWQSWLICLGIILVAIAGKLGGSMLTARWTGMSWHDSFSIGVLMNTRGLIELVVLNIGYDLGILPARIFAIMVLMALFTTSMTGPLLSLLKRRQQSESVLTTEGMRSVEYS